MMMDNDRKLKLFDDLMTDPTLVMNSLNLMRETLVAELDFPRAMRCRELRDSLRAFVRDARAAERAAKELA